MADPRALADLCETRAKTEPRFDTFVGGGPDKTTRNYVVLYPTGGSVLEAERQAGSQDRSRWTLRVVCVGLASLSNCLYVVKYARPLFKNWTPIPSEEYTSWLEEQDDDAPPIRDDSVPGDIRFSITLRYTLTTRS